MNVMLLGSGGRESALAWSFNQSDLCNELHVIPGNGGTHAKYKTSSLDINDFEEVEKYCEENSIKFIVVGPEVPLINGIWDYFESKDIQVFGPSKAAALLEGSKYFAKQFMDRNNIPTASMFRVDASNIDDAIQHINDKSGPYVLKADGLAAGKGVLIETDAEAAIASLREMLSGKFGDASNEVLIEDFLSGIEFSVFVLTDGDNYRILPIAKDYKRIGEGDQGLNTGGMGAISPVSFVTKKLMDKVENQIIIPTIEGIKKEGLNYQGVVFIGLIVVDEEPFVIEYNCRFGDPETEVIVPRIDEDLLSLLKECCDGKLSSSATKIKPEACTTVMMVSGGYPEAYEKNKIITGLEELKDVLLFHAGTKAINGQVYSSGGRVIALSALGDTVEEALAKSYQAAAIINFDKKYYRRDIGFDL